ncbi:group I intron endonuclease (plasmid) [[Clostridium] sordellii]|uniref:NUMOD1 domain-containing DNA-binding protein n=1 Tax=Paraclostridium sordellii TaxID=1505 RepID=UPI00054096A7|nr:NUMOD1 domain-containing DNA-binding protein [Paeniclostridium sordellii]CEK36595.1 group I intron endonuclease (plasmid) [[Clostridium] sordellii] [Paeniclostridium sordellii]
MARSLTYNIVNDDLTMNNYFALVAMILNPDLKYQKALNLFGIADKATLDEEFIDGNFKKIKKNKERLKSVKVIDIDTDEVKIYQSLKEIEFKLGIKSKYISAYIADRKLYKGKYRFYRLNEDGASEND